MEKPGKLISRVGAFLLSLLLCLAGFSDGGKVYAAEAVPCLSPPTKAKTLIPVGKAVGIKLFAEGILVVDLDPGSPAAAFLKVGDFIISADGETISSTEKFQEKVQSCKGETMTLCIRRGEKEKTLTVTPVEESGIWRIGAYVRDSMAGIGTLSYVDPVTGEFAALGHSINDVDTGLLMPLQSGGIMAAAVSRVQKGLAGAPGQLKGRFDQSCDLGTLNDNNDCGIFGTLADDSLCCGKALEVAERHEVKEGPAEILAEVGEDGVQHYSVEISKIYPLSGKTRNMLITVTDERLISQTGGIVQGMSGSPIVQNGKLIGAVTHVLLENPQQGYGIFIENMLSAAEEKSAA